MKCKLTLYVSLLLACAVESSTGASQGDLLTKQAASPTSRTRYKIYSVLCSAFFCAARLLFCLHQLSALIFLLSINSPTYSFVYL